MATMGGKGKGLGEFDGPYMMAFRRQGGLPSRLLVADYGNNRVHEVWGSGRWGNDRGIRGRTHSLARPDLPCS